MTAQELTAKGYRRISNKHKMVSRIDREDWIRHMAEQHAPWDVEGEGMTWASGAHMTDHYRRVYSKDVIYLDDRDVFRAIPASHWQYRNWEDVGYVK